MSNNCLLTEPIKANPPIKFQNKEEYKLSDWRKGCDNKLILLPPFQRKYQWTQSLILKLLHDVLLGRCINNLHLCQMNNENPLNLRCVEYMRLDRNESLDIQMINHNSNLQLILLDSQQRLRTLLGACYFGKFYIYKTEGATDEPIKKMVFINLKVENYEKTNPFILSESENITFEDDDSLYINFSNLLEILVNEPASMVNEKIKSLFERNEIELEDRELVDFERTILKKISTSYRDEKIDLTVRLDSKTLSKNEAWSRYNGINTNKQHTGQTRLENFLSLEWPEVNQDFENLAREIRFTTKEIFLQFGSIQHESPFKDSIMEEMVNSTVDIEKWKREKFINYKNKVIQLKNALLNYSGGVWFHYFFLQKSNKVKIVPILHDMIKNNVDLQELTDKKEYIKYMCYVISKNKKAVILRQYFNKNHANFQNLILDFDSNEEINILRDFISNKSRVRNVSILLSKYNFEQNDEIQFHHIWPSNLLDTLDNGLPRNHWSDEFSYSKNSPWNYVIIKKNPNIIRSNRPLCDIMDSDPSSKSKELVTDEMINLSRQNTRENFKLYIDKSRIHRIEKIKELFDTYDVKYSEA